MSNPNPPRTLPLALDGRPLDPQTLWTLAQTALDPAARWAIHFSPAALARMQASAGVVARMSRAGQPVYGVNTGFGHFAERRIPPGQLEQLQTNLIRSHACGVGEETSRDIVLAMWLLRLDTISRGHSGIRPATVEFFLRLLRAGVLGCVPSRGSVGASGDLAPSAHAVMIVLGEGFCTRPLAGGAGFERVHAAEALAQLGMKPLPLGAKEGLVLINGTQYTTALALKAWHEAKQLLKIANLAAVMNMEAMGATLSILDEAVLRTHHPQTLTVGQEMAAWLAGIAPARDAEAERRLVQAPYCLRCAPQVHGAVLLAIESAEATLAAEIGAVCDNPLVFPELNGGEIHSCGNFHAIYPARASDNLASALATVGAIAERRINMAMDERLSGLPPFLTEHGGLNSGMMMAQVTAAALAGECRLLALPASVETIPTNGDREDHVSMGPAAGLKALQIAGLVRQILAIELLVAAQAMDLRRPAVMPERLGKAHRLIRQVVPFLAQDRVLAGDMAVIGKLIDGDALL